MTKKQTFKNSFLGLNSVETYQKDKMEKVAIANCSKEDYQKNVGYLLKIQYINVTVILMCYCRYIYLTINNVIYMEMFYRDCAINNKSCSKNKAFFAS